MKVLAIITFLLVSSLLLGACSTQYRNADAQISEDDLFSVIENTIQNSSSSSTLNDLINDDSTVIYFADSAGPLGGVESVVSFIDFSWLGMDSELTVWDLEDATVIFLDGFDSDDFRIFYLVVDITDIDGNRTTQVFSSTDGDYVFDDDGAVIYMTDGIVINSFDIADDVKDEFGGAIQLRVGVERDGGLDYVGKFSTLVGFQ